MGTTRPIEEIFATVQAPDQLQDVQHLGHASTTRRLAQ